MLEVHFSRERIKFPDGNLQHGRGNIQAKKMLLVEARSKGGGKKKRRSVSSIV